MRFESNGKALDRIQYNQVFEDTEIASDGRDGLGIVKYNHHVALSAMFDVPMPDGFGAVRSDSAPFD